MSGFFGLLQKRITTKVAVWYLRQKNLATLLESIALVLDGSLQALYDGMRLSYPYRCAPEGLISLSLDRGIRLYDTEPDASKRDRLAHWWLLWKQKGSHQGEMRHARPYFMGADGKGIIPTIRIVHQCGDGSSATWHTVNGATGIYSAHKVTPSNFNYDGRPALWSRFWVFIYMAGTGIAVPPLYGDGHDYGDGTLYGGGLTPGQCADIAKMFYDWKASHSWLGGVWLVWDASSVDPLGTPTQDGEGRWSLPNGTNTWSALVDPTTGKPTRPLGIQQIFDNPAP